MSLSLTVLASLAIGCSDERDVSPLDGSYGAEVIVETSDPSPKMNLATHGPPLIVTMTRLGEDQARFRFPFPAKGPMELLEDDGEKAIPLPSFRPSLPLGAPAVGTFDPRKLLDTLVTADGRIILSFPDFTLVARPDGVDDGFPLDGSADPRPLYQRGDRVGSFFVRNGELFDLPLGGAPVPTGIKTVATHPVLAVSTDDEGVYVWVQTSAARLEKRHVPVIAGREERSINLTTALANALANGFHISASIAPDGTLWIARAENAGDLIDSEEAIVTTRLAPDATAFTDSEEIETVDDDIEHLRIRATNEGLRYYVCAHDSPNGFDDTDRRFCFVGMRSTTGPSGVGPGRQGPPDPDDKPILSLLPAANVRARCPVSGPKPEERDVEIMSGATQVLRLYPSSNVEIAAIASSPSGGLTVTAISNGSVYALRTAR